MKRYIKQLFGVMLFSLFLTGCSAVLITPSSDSSNMHAVNAEKKIQEIEEYLRSGEMSIAKTSAFLDDLDDVLTNCTDAAKEKDEDFIKKTDSTIFIQDGELYLDETDLKKAPYIELAPLSTRVCHFDTVNDRTSVFNINNSYLSVRGDRCIRMEFMDNSQRELWRYEGAGFNSQNQVYFNGEVDYQYEDTLYDRKGGGTAAFKDGTLIPYKTDENGYWWSEGDDIHSSEIFENVWEY